MPNDEHRKPSDGVHLYNVSPDRITNSAAQNFITDVETELKKGYGLVPFIGAGLSAPSGAPLVWEIKSYLERCIGLALGVEEPGMRPWNPRTDQWPPFIDRERSSQINWWLRVRDEFERRRDLDEWDLEVPVFQEALGAMAEWRTALLFLSRFMREKRASGHGVGDVIVMDAPDQEVIDSCIREVMKGKQPTLGHRMLANLEGLLRLDIILTTNFDDLLEKAFADAGHPLTLFDIHLNSSLPSASALSNQRSIVKLHGHRHSLRADYSLDALPSEADRGRFLEYLLSAEGRQFMSERRLKGEDAERLPFQNHLLVMGFSAAEHRTRSFIEHAWLHLNSHFRVFWLCHTEKDVKSVSYFTRYFIEKTRSSNDKGGFSQDWRGSRVLRYQYLGLLFLQLFQSIRRGLPNSGMIFPSISRLTVPPMKPELEAEANPRAARHSDELRERIRVRLSSFRRPGFELHKLIVVTSLPEARGVTAVCAEVFDEFQDGGDICLWIDMNDISSTDDLFEQLLDAAYYRLGIENWMPVYVANDPRIRAAEIRRLAQSKNGHWVIFLNGRETPGANVTEFSEDEARKRPNNWLDIKRTEVASEANSKDYSRCQECFFELLTELCGPPSHTISVVFLCRQADADDPPVIKALRENEMIDRPERLESAYVSMTENESIVGAIRWTNNEPPKRRFLYALCLMQRVRLLATVWSDAVLLPDHGEATYNTAFPVLAWIDELESKGLIRRKPGGFIWMHAQARNRLRHMLSDPAAREKFITANPNTNDSFKDWNTEADEAEIHYRLAQWYRRVLSSSNSPAALFEAVYHLCRAAQTRIVALATLDGFEFASDQLDEASSILRTHSFLIQTHGYSRGSCRRLEFIRDNICTGILDVGHSLKQARISAESPAAHGTSGGRGSRRRKRLDGNLALKGGQGSARQEPRSPGGQLPIGNAGLNDDFTNIDNVCHRLGSAVKWLRLCCTEVMRAIAREVGEDSRAYLRQREVRALLSGRDVADAGLGGIGTEELYESLFKERDHKYHGLIREPATEWVRWWKWNVMLGIASRSYSAARSALVKGLQSASLFAELPQDKSYPLAKRPKVSDEEILKLFKVVVERCSNGSISVLGDKVDRHQPFRIELLRLIEQFVFLRLQESSLTRRRGESGPVLVWDDSGRKVLLIIIEESLVLADQVVGHDHSSDAHYTIPAMWCRSRLLMHKSMCVARRAVHATQSDNWQEAMKTLNDADACLNYYDPRRQGTDRAVVELHRAEIRLWEANSIEVLEGKMSGSVAPLTFEAFCGLLAERNQHESLLWRPSGQLLRDGFYKDLDGPFRRSDGSETTASEGMRRARSLVQDAIRFLSRAEQALLNRRRNVWWTTWFLQRKLVAIAMSVWGTVLEIGTPIPVLGLEAAPRKTMTEADSLLDDAFRMIRVDAYRLATVIEAYASCATALHVRLMLDAKAIRLPERQRRMHSELVAALGKLNDVRDARKHWANRMHPKSVALPTDEVLVGIYDNASLAGSLDDYINGVVFRCEKALLFLKNPLL